MDNLAADFIINNNDSLEAEYIVEPSETFDCSFEVFASGTVWGSIAGDIENQSDLINVLNGKQDVLIAGDNIQIENNVISATDTTYTAGTGISIENGVISNTQTAAEWGNITGTLSNQTDLYNELDTLSGQIAGNHQEISNIHNTIQGYGDIVSYNAADFATSIQGGLADTALQPNDNISELNNNVGYITSSSLPTVNNNTITIQKNGTTIESFTLNQASNETINITVPTDTNDLTNGAGFLVNNATGTNALAVGNTSQSTAEGGVAVGYGARANSTYSTAIGEDTRATNTNTTVIGRAAKATQARAIAIGSGAEANAQDAIAIKGINNTANTFQVYTYNMLDMSTGLIPDARISTNIARSADVPTFDTTQMAAINSGANTTNIGQIATNTQDISDEITNRQNADNGLQSQIDALVVSSDVFDVVGTYAELQAYDISTVPVNDIIKVLVDSTHNDAATYYRCTETGGVKSWTYIGAEGAYYTKSEADNKFVEQTVTINGQALSSNVTLTATDVGALPDSTVIPTVNNSSIDFQINGTSFDTITLNQSSNDTINILVPTDTSDLTNGAGYITAASLPTDYYTKAEIDAIIPQPTKTPIVYYQPTNSYCYDGSDNRYYGSHVLEKLYLVKPKTSGTEQVIDMSTTFSLSFTIDYQKAPISAVTVAEIMVSYAAGKGVLLQLNSTGLYYRNNVTGTTITGTRALTAGNSYDIKAEYDGTHMIISYKLSSDANYTQINSTTCTCDGSNYNYAAIGMNADNGNMSLSSVVLTNGADTLYSYTTGKIALDYDGSTLKLNASNQLSVDFTGYATETWVGNQGYITGISSNDVTTALGYTPYNATNPNGYITSSALTNYVTTNTAQDISGRKTFLGEKAIYFKQSATTNKLGFTLYNPSNTELGAFEWRPSTIGSGALLNINAPYSSINYVGFRYWGTAVNIVAPKVATAGNYYIPTHITDGNTTVTANNTGTVNISSLLPSGSTVDQVYDSTSANAQSGVAIEGELSSNYQSKLVSGTNIKTINNTSVLGSGDIDTSEIFVATYGSTTFDEISNAINAGKYVFLLNSGTPTYLLPLTSIDNVGGAEFYGYVGGGITYLRVCDTSDNWTSSSGTIGTVTSVNNVSPVSGNVTLSIPTDTNDLTNGAKFLQNTSTQSNSIVVGGTVNNKNLAVCIGNNSTAYVYCTAIGASATTTGNYQTVLGYNSKASGTYSTALGEGSYANGGNSIAVGGSAKTSATGAVAIGNTTTASGSDATCIGYQSQATDTYASALGYTAKATANSAIQLGYGTNSTANTLSVGFYNSSSTHYIWQLLDGTTGLIPDARISSDIARADLSNLSATGKTVIDGQWVLGLNYTLSSATAIGTYTCDLTSYLPSGNDKYEVLLDCQIVATNSTYVGIKDGTYDNYAFCATGGSRPARNIIVIALTGKTFKYDIAGAALSSGYLRLRGYRRIGTNT